MKSWLGGGFSKALKRSQKPDPQAEPTQRVDAERAGVSVHSWWILGVVTALYVGGYLDRFIITLVVSDIKLSLGITDTQMGLILGPAFALAYALFSLPSGWLADRYSRSLVIFWGAVLFAFATALSGMADTFTTMLLCRIAVGIGEASLVPAALSLIGDKFPKDRLTTAVSIFSMAPKIGVAVAYALGAVIVAAAAFLVSHLSLFEAVEPWRLVFVLTGLPSLMLGFLCLTFRGTKPVSVGRGGSEDNRAIKFLVKRKALFLPMLIGISAVLICGQAIVAWVPSHLDREFGWEAVSYGPLLGLVSAIGAGTLVLKGMVMDRLYARGVKDIHLRFFTWLLICTYPIAVASFLVSDRIFFVLTYAIISIVTIPCVAYAAVVIQMVTPSMMRGRVFALFSVPMAVIGGLGPPIVGVMTDFFFRDEAKLGWSMALLIAVCLPIAIVSLRFALTGLRSAVEEAV